MKQGQIEGIRVSNINGLKVTNMDIVVHIMAIPPVFQDEWDLKTIVTFPNEQNKTYQFDTSIPSTYTYINLHSLEGKCTQIG